MQNGGDFGLVTVEWLADPVVSLRLRDDTGEIVVRQSFKLSLLKPDEKKDGPALPAGVIGPREALTKLGEEVTVQMAVQGGRSFKERVLMNSEKDFRSEKNLTVVLNAKGMTGKWEKATFETFKDKTIRVKGKVTKFAAKGSESLQIEVNDEKQLEIVEK